MRETKRQKELIKISKKMIQKEYSNILTEKKRIMHEIKTI